MTEYAALVEELTDTPASSRPSGSDGVEGLGTDASIKGFTVADQSSDQQRFDLTHWASVNDIRSLKFCLERQKVSPDYRDEDGLTALMRAADRGATEAVRALLAAGADVHAMESEGQTALHYAVLCDFPEIAGLLVSAGSDMHVQDRDGQSPRDCATTQLRAVMDAAADGHWVDTNIGTIPRERPVSTHWHNLHIFVTGAAAIAVLAVVLFPLLSH